jgi:NADH-quinone oxidoreductase subunit M
MFGGLVALLPVFGRGEQGIRRCRFWSICIASATVLLLAMILNSSLLDFKPTLVRSESYRWIPSLGIAFRLTLDGLSLVFTLLTAVVTWSVLVWSSRPATAGRGWYAALLAAEAFVMGAFLATDLVVFYLFYELMLLPVLVGIALWGGVQRMSAAFTFLMYTLVGSVLMFVAILYLGFLGNGFKSVGDYAFDAQALSALHVFTAREELWLGLAFLVAFAVKIPVVPLHGWVRATYCQAPYGLAAFTAALLGKVGIYGVLRFVVPLFPQLFVQAGPYLAVLGATGVVYGAVVALAQRDLRSMLAYSSISHLGFCVLGLSAPIADGNYLAQSGVVFQAVSHGIIAAALFLTFGAIATREGREDFESLGGLAGVMPRNAFFLMIFTVAAVGLPLTSGFVGEFLIILGSWKGAPCATAVALLGVVFGAVYALTAYLRTMFGERRGAASVVASGADLHGSDLVVAAVLSVLIIALGVFPQPLLTVVEPALRIELQGADGRAGMRLESFEEVQDEEPQSNAERDAGVSAALRS